ncbi:hypothetical protein F0562_021921 [Nyssa sinensis]|uniref:Uncharacterized protein n=1 Tax=Nyssa sinensis TaxID=561372 RepID=A0A5J5BQA4_9ASTE|nr:hypothetical protein F0562_021921 [Nyssa sinensis]
MGSFSGLGIGLSLLFVCILLSVVGELYYLLWWKKRISSRNREAQDHYTDYGKELFYLSCWKKPTSLNNSNNTQELTPSVRNPDVNGHEPDLELGSGKDLLQKGSGEESVESELMRLHNLCGPPRFLFTIKEETKEDLESDDGKSRGDRSRKGSRARSLSDLIVAVETPFLSPLSSPPSKAHPHPLDSYNHHGFNPLFESSTDAELYRLRSSPPPKFKFLRDAEEKLMRRLMEEAEKMAHNRTVVTEEKDDSVFKIIVGNDKEREPHLLLPQYHSSASQASVRVTSTRNQRFLA